MEWCPSTVATKDLETSAELLAAKQVQAHPQVQSLLILRPMAFRERQVTVLGRKRKEYHDLVAEYCYHLQDIRSEEEVIFTVSWSHVLTNGHEQIGALRQVVVDVPRTAPGVQILQTERLQKSLEHILYVWGIRSHFCHSWPFSCIIVGCNTGIRQAVTFRGSTI